MLPNWLYGKSLRKLQEIFSDGSTPPDYIEVKAQVTQNTESISEIYDVMGKTGSKNWLKLTDVITGAEKATITNKGANIKVKNIKATSWARFAVKIDVQPNTDYIMSTHINYISGKARVAIRNADDSVNIYESSDIQSDVDFSQQFNTGANSQVVVRLFCTANTSESGEVNYENTMIRLATDVDPTFVPYAMTNREITDVLTADANLNTPVDLSSYTSYSNLYTAPSDGYVHFISAASGSATRAIYTYGNNTTAATDPHFTHSTSANNKAFEIFIKKGLKVYTDGLQSGDTINFYPLS